MADIGRITPARPVWHKKPQVEEKGDDEGKERGQARRQNKKDDEQGEKRGPDDTPHVDVTV